MSIKSIILSDIVNVSWHRIGDNKRDLCRFCTMAPADTEMDGLLVDDLISFLVGGIIIGRNKNPPDREKTA
jgi:hypothetical protein